MCDSPRQIGHNPLERILHWLVCTYMKFLPGWDCYKSTYVKYDIVLRYHVTDGLHNISTEDKRLGPKCVGFHCNNLYPSPICLLIVPPSPNNYIVPSHFVPSITLYSIDSEHFMPHPFLSRWFNFLLIII